MSALIHLIQNQADSIRIVREGSYTAADSAGIGGAVMRFLRSIGQRGTLTMPQEVREVLDVQEGDIVEFEVVAVRRRGNTDSPSTPSPIVRTPLEPAK